MKRAKIKIFDVALPIYEKMPVYPNNPRVRITPLRTPTTSISEITFGSHTGTHVDAPRHVSRKGTPVDEISPAVFIGPCRVLDMARCGRAITIEDIIKARVRKGERIFVKTRNSLRGFRKFYDDYIYLDGNAAEFLATKRIVLFGIDSLSVKQRGSKDVRPHTALLNRNIPIIEGLDLSHVEPGRYFFVGLPLRFKGLDGAPLRAVLMRA